jgi:hypothetical protein
MVYELLTKMEVLNDEKDAASLVDGDFYVNVDDWE